MNYETTVDASSSDHLTGDPLADAEREEKARNRRKLIIAALVVLAVVIVVALLATRSGRSSDASAASQAPTVTVVQPGQTTVQGTIQATGTLAARREMPVGVAGEGGRVISVNVDAGQWVRAGQVLAVIDRSVQVQLSRNAAANIDAAKADADIAQSNLDRGLKLVDRGFISKADIDKLTATRDAAVARVKIAQAQYGERNARNAQLNVVAPAAGYVLERNVEPGQVVSASGTALFNIAKDGQFELLAQVSETDLAKLHVGVTGQVTPVGTDKSFTCQIWQLSPVIEQQTRQGTARCALPYAPELRVGGFASAVINSGTIVAPMLPESAILNDDKGSYVYVVGKGNKVERRAVKTGLVTENGIAVTEGLSGNELIVRRAGGFLNPGDEVKPRRVNN
ncbi:MAG: efflux RND transporter periplasmic adaptor subunit [Novosphingobium sp.]|nr:efflux RND transporter periplasmic adaptor subunit [Novosphingobium sp.]MBO9603420.1 efflux RND transporter periplasmic adaptor subunit [Novosphingobium sp.]